MDSELLRLNKEDDVTHLKEYVQSLDVNYMCSELSRMSLKDEGAVCLQILLSGLSNTPACQEKRYKISLTILNDVKNKLISSRLADKLISVLGAGIDSFLSAHLIRLVEMCMGMIQNSNEPDAPNCWRDFLPKLINVLVEKENIEHNGTSMSGLQYRSEVITAICTNDWPENAITNIASMFAEMPLSAEEHLKVVNKLCKCLLKMKPDEIPPLTHQILQLTKNQHSMALFVALNEYFDLRLYRNLDNLMTFTQAGQASGINLKELQIVEGTVLYHIYTAPGQFGPHSIKDFFKNLKESLPAPQFILQPFFLTLLLTVSNISYDLKEETCNILKSAIFRTITEEEKVFESAWLETVVPKISKIDVVIDKVMRNCFRERDKVLNGLVDLGFTLLSVPKTRGKESLCDEIWNAGNNILVKLVEKYSDVTSTVLQRLANQISQVHECPQYTDCLFRIARKSPLSLLDCSSVLVQLLDNICARLTGEIGERVVAAMLPLTKMSHSLRDNVIIVLRKALFPHDKACRKMAVSGFLELLKDLKISDLRSFSQSMSQNYCGLTQIYSGAYDNAGASHSNEGLCLEILSVLKEVFKHQSEVKSLFYKKVFDSVCANPELASHVLDILQNRFDKFYRGNNEVPPLHLQKIVDVQGAEIVVQEPIADLVLAVGLIVSKLKDDGTRSSKLREMLDSLCERMIQSDIPHFNIEKNDDIDETEHLMKQELIRQILGVYESLMGFTLCTWKIDSVNNGQTLSSLFKGYSKLSDYAKSLGKPEKKKDDQGKKGKDKVKTIPFKFGPTVLNLRCASRLLSLLNESNLKWASEESIIPVKGKRELHRYSMQVTLTLIKQAENLSSTALTRSGYTLKYLCKIGRILYNNCLKRISEAKQFDVHAGATAVECFSELLSLVLSRFKSKFPAFLSDISGVLIEQGIEIQLKTIVDDLLDQTDELLKDEDDDEESKDEEQQSKKISALLVAIVTTFVNELPRTRPYLQQVLDKIKKICKERKVENPNVAKSLLALFTSTYRRTKASGGLLLDLANCLCDEMNLIDEEMEVEEHATFAVINPKTANVCLVALCEAVKHLVNEVEWVVSRFKAELITFSFPLAGQPMENRQSDLNERERDLCRHFNFSIKVLSTLCTIAIPPGVYSDALLKELGNAYNKLGLLTKYFILKVGKYQQPLRTTSFEKTVKLVDNGLSKNMFCFTDHVISHGEVDDRTNKQKTNKDPAMLKNKALKETKIIPKITYEKEQFQKFILQLSKTSKVDLVGQTKLTMARDYKIVARQVKEIIEKENIQTEEDMETDDPTDETQTSPNSKRQRTSE